MSGTKGAPRNAPMNITLTVLGFAIIFATIVDSLRTTMQLGQGGTASTVVAKLIWKVFVSLSKWPAKSLQILAGPAVVTGIVFTWVGGLWLGWFLVLAADVNAVVNTSSGVAADLWSRFYFAGFSVVTLGVGDYSPGTTFAQIVTIGASMSGFFVFTLAITYAAPVLNAVVSNRHLAGYVTALGPTGDRILINAWNGRSFGNLDQHLIELTTMILLMGRRYLAYPVLHYFHTRDRSMSVSLSLAALHDALMLLEHGVEESARCDPATLKPLRAAFAALWHGERLQFAEPSEEAPPLPSLERLRHAGIPVVSDATFRERIERLREDRRTLRGFVQRRGWSWDELNNEDNNQNSV